MGEARVLPFLQEGPALQGQLGSLGCSTPPRRGRRSGWRRGGKFRAGWAGRSPRCLAHRTRLGPQPRGPVPGDRQRPPPKGSARGLNNSRGGLGLTTATHPQDTCLHRRRTRRHLNQELPISRESSREVSDETQTGIGLILPA